MKTSIFSFAAGIAFLAISAFSISMPGYQVGDKATDFSLKNIDGKSVSLASDKSAKGYIVVFTCNTCPVAQAYEQRVIDLNKQFEQKGYPVIAINANDGQLSPGDSYEEMKKRASEKKYAFPYLTDETQQVARAFGAMHTPTVFVVQRQGSDFIVKYIGAIDNNAQDGEQASQKYVQNAVSALLTDQPVAVPTAKAIGCGIKWKKA
jgi:peroxiredoxin